MSTVEHAKGTLIDHANRFGPKLLVAIMSLRAGDAG